MSNEVIEWPKELVHEFKCIYSGFKGLINKVKKVKTNREMEINKLIKEFKANRGNRIKSNKKKKIKFKEDKKNKVDGYEIVVINKGGNNLFANLCLLYLCILSTLVVVGLLSYLAGINEKLPVNKLIYYADKAVDFFQRADDINGANRFLGWLYQYDELPYWRGMVEWQNISSSLVSEVS